MCLQPPNSDFTQLRSQMNQVLQSLLYEFFCEISTGLANMSTGPPVKIFRVRGQYAFQLIYGDPLPNNAGGLGQKIW